MIGFIRRAITHTSPTHMHLVHKEIQFKTKQFAYSGYPKSIIHNKINHTMTKVLYPQHLPPANTKSEQEDLKWLPLFLPWSGDESHNIIKQLRRTIPNDFAKISIAYNTTKLRLLLLSFSSSDIPHSPDSPSRFQHNNLVYKYTCECGQVYIGETKRRLAIRIHEHQTQKTSAIFEHNISCTASNTIDRDKFTIIAKRLRHREARKRYESIYIRYYDKKARSTMNNCKSSRELVIF